MDRGLQDAVERFTRTVGVALGDAANGTTVDSTELHQNARIEAFNLCCAMIDSDGRQTDDELWALVGAFGPSGLLPDATSPSDLRRSDLVKGKSSWLTAPSDLFKTLLEVDKLRGTNHAATYVDEAMAIAYMVASLDQFPSRDELQAAAGLEGLLRTQLSTLPTLTPSDSTDHQSAAGHEATQDQAAESTQESTGPEPEPLEDVLAELDKLIGLTSVKEEVRLLSSLLRVQKLRVERGLPSVDSNKHLVFSGNPGTGKTTVARLLARIYHSLEVVPKGQLVEVDRSGLVAGFVGQTAGKVATVFDSADGGVLLIDEAYSLVRGSDKDFGREAIDAIVKQVEDRRDSMVVILAGYPDEMATLINANPGFRSRFPKSILFPDYDNDELLAILGLISAGSHYALTPDAQDVARTWFGAHSRDYGFGNGRLARNLFESAVARHASRIVKVENPTDDELSTIEAVDVAAVPTPASAPTADGEYAS